MATNQPFTELDFDQVKDNLKAYLASQDRFKDYDFAGSNMNVLLDLLAYNTFQNNFYTNMALSEMFLDSAQLKDSIVSHAKELNYLPGSRHSAQATLDISLSVPNAPKNVVIPRNTKFVAKCGNRTLNFFNEDAITVDNVNNLFSVSGVSVYEGTNIREVYEVTSTEDKFVLTNDTVDTNSIRVYVRDNTTEGSNTREYKVSPNIFGVSSTDEVFYIQASQDDKYEVTFGNNTFGKSPAIGNVVEIEYRITSGEGANGAKNFSAANPISGYTAVVTTVSPAEGGTERETNESIKFFAPKSIQVQDRAVTERDYEIILKNNFSEIQAVSVYGGEELNPPRYGRVVIAVDVKNADGVSETNKEKYRRFLEDRSPIGIEPIVVSPQFMYVDVVTEIFYNIEKTNQSSADIVSKVEAAIQAYSDSKLADFKKTFRESPFRTAIDASDDSIISNQTSILAIMPINPELNVNSSFSLEFNNEIFQEQALLDTDNLASYRYGIKSSSFTYNGSNAFIHDDGKGKLHIMTSTGTGFVYLKRNIGIVDYTSGLVTISDLNVSAFDGAEIRVFGRIVSEDITAPKDRILSIRPRDVKVTVTGTKD